MNQRTKQLMDEYVASVRNLSGEPTQEDVEKIELETILNAARSARKWCNITFRLQLVWCIAIAVAQACYSRPFSIMDCLYPALVWLGGVVVLLAHVGVMAVWILILRDRYGVDK